MGKTAILLMGLFTGFISLVLQGVSLGTEYWFVGTVQGQVKDYYGSNETISLEEIPVLVRNRGLFSFCGYYYDTNISSTQVPSLSENFQGPEGLQPSDGELWNVINVGQDVEFF